MLNIFKNKFFAILFITLVVLVLMAVSAGRITGINILGNLGTAPLAPLQNAMSFVEKKVEDTAYIFKDIKAVREENEQLRKENDELRKKARDLEKYEAENRTLRETLNIKDQFSDYSTIGANVIANDLGNWFHTYTIDRGTKDGVYNDAPILTSKGLVGLVSNAGVFSSKIITVIDENSTIMARVTRTRDLVRVRGSASLRSQGLCQMDYIPPDADIAAGDLIETSDSGGIFPKGILIGKVKEVRQVTSELTRYAIIEPVVDFKRLEEVIILRRVGGNIPDGGETP